MKDIFRISLLFDFYGDLLTDSQKNHLSSYINDDLTKTEIAIENNISRQGVHDSIKRSISILTEYENRLGLVERFQKIRSEISKLEELIEDLSISNEDKKCMIDLLTAVMDKM